MSILEKFVESPLAGMIGWTLLHSVWEGVIISAVLAAVLLSIRSPRTRYAAACATMLVMLGAFVLTMLRLMPEQVHGLQGFQAPALPAWNVLSDKDASGSWNPSFAAIAPWLGPFWITGVWLICLWRLASWISVQRLRRRGVCCAPDHWQKELARLSAQLRVSRPVLLLESCLADVPMVLGHFRPLILMPIGLLVGMPPGQIEAILLHELAHIRRHDYLVNVMQRLAEALLFYHPAVWWMSSVIRTERENCCDDVVVSITGNAHEYALALAALEQNRISGPEPAIAITGGHLMKRIHRVLYRRAPNGAWAPLLAVAIFLVTAAVSVAAWQSEPSKHSSPAAQPQPDGTATSSYSKIDDAERAASASAQNSERTGSDAVIWAMRVINTAEVRYEQGSGKGYSPTLAALGSSGNGYKPAAKDVAMLNDALAGAKKAGYAFVYKCGAPDKDGRISTYAVVARPAKWKEGSVSVYTDDSGKIRGTSENRDPTVQDPLL